MGTDCTLLLTIATMSHELIYFDAAGRAEPIRIMLHAAGIEFTDNRFNFNKWAEIKPSTPLGSAPVLKIEGVQYTQSVALARYAAKQAGFYPEDPLQALICDETCDSLSELITKAPGGADEEEPRSISSRKFDSILETHRISYPNEWWNQHRFVL